MERIVKGEESLRFGDLDVRFFRRNFEIREEKKESIVVLLEGQALFKVRDKVYKVKKTGDFGSKPSAIYLPSGRGAKIETNKDSLLLCVEKPQERGGRVKLFRPRDIKTTYEGINCTRWKERNICTGHGIACSELLSFPGRWFKTPEVKDGLRLLFFRVNPDTGFGALHLTEETIEKLYMIRNGTLINFEDGMSMMTSAPDSSISCICISRIESEATKLGGVEWT